jgi:caffeoyl-CoA O-methyltransferase
MGRSSYIDDTVGNYAEAHSAQPDDIQRDLIAATATLGGASGMQIGPDQGAFMAILTAVLQPQFAVEIGTFTGYSSLAVARALPDGGRLLCCDISKEWTDIARVHWERAGISHRIDLVIAPATETLAGLPDDQQIDLAFIDADKTSYLDYYEAIVPRLSERGVILIDNTLWSGRVTHAPTDDDDNDTIALRALNDHVHADPRTEAVQLTIGDGVTMVRRR